MVSLQGRSHLLSDPNFVLDLADHSDCYLIDGLLRVFGADVQSSAFFTFFTGSIFLTSVSLFSFFSFYSFFNCLSSFNCFSCLGRLSSLICLSCSAVSTALAVFRLQPQPSPQL